MKLNKTTWFSAITAAAVLGSMAAPIVASAHSAGEDATENATDVKPENKPEKVRGNALATALGVTPEALSAAMKAARAAVPALTEDQKKDEAARKAHAAAVEAALAQQLGITVDALDAAQAKLKAEVVAKKDERSATAEAKAKEHFTQLLARLVGAGVITQAQADEIQTQYNLGGDAKETVIKRLRSLLQQEKADQQFAQMLKRLVGAGVLTQAQADEALAQYKLGGDAKETVIKRLRSLLQEQKPDRKPDAKRDPKDQKKDEKRGQQAPALERQQKSQHRGNAS